MAETLLRVVLALVLASAAFAKLTSPRSSIAALETFGFGDEPLRPIAWASLIAVELGLAVAVALGSDGAAYGAAALMLLFAALTVAALLRGQAGAPCACFGPKSTVSWLGVARNLALALGFALIPSVNSLSAQAWLAIGVGVTLISCVALAVAVLALAREVGMLRLQLGTQGALEIAGEGPEIGSRADQLSGRLEMKDERLGLAVFTSEGCHVCQTLGPAIENVGRDPLVAVRTFDEVAEAEMWSSLEIPGSPFAIALKADGTVLAKGTFNNLSQLESVLGTAERRRSQGIPAPGGGQAETEGKLGRLPIGA